MAPSAASATVQPSAPPTQPSYLSFPPGVVPTWSWYATIPDSGSAALPCVQLKTRLSPALLAPSSVGVLGAPVGPVASTISSMCTLIGLPVAEMVLTSIGFATLS